MDQSSPAQLPRLTPMAAVTIGLLAIATAVVATIFIATLNA